MSGRPSGGLSHGRSLSRRAAGWAVTCAVLWLGGGVRGLLLGYTLIAWDLSGRPSPRQLLAVATVLLGLVPIAVLLRGVPDASTISPLLVADAQAAHLLAGAGLALLVIGVVRDVREDVARDAPIEEDPPWPAPGPGPEAAPRGPAGESHSGQGRGAAG